MVGLLAAASIEGLAELIAADPERRRTWERPLRAGSFGAVGALGAYLGWSARRDRRRSPR